MTEKINDGGPAFPRPALGTDCGTHYGQQDGMSLRDWFAATVDKDEYGDILFKNLSRDAGELLAGPYPEEPKTRPEKAAWRLACIEWEFRVRAALRFMMADAMLAARQRAEAEDA